MYMYRGSSQLYIKPLQDMRPSYASHISAGPLKQKLTRDTRTPLGRAPLRLPWRPGPTVSISVLMRLTFLAAVIMWRCRRFGRAPNGAHISHVPGMSSD